MQGVGVHTQEQQHGWVQTKRVFNHSLSSDCHRFSPLPRSFCPHPREVERQGRGVLWLRVWVGC
uniref:Uncharacterized protein n=1 Tax=Rhizophora mucronata TaxID=61149 RepID=A0A2P2JG68_RHIMU